MSTHDVKVKVEDEGFVVVGSSNVAPLVPCYCLVLYTVSIAFKDKSSIQ